MRKCKRCGETKPLTSEYFDASPKAIAGLQYTCKPCARERTKFWQQDNKDRVRAYNKKKSEQINAFLAEKKRVPCADCGVQYPPHIMDFDHLRDKEAALSVMANSRVALAKVVAEIAKCEIVCSNCHRDRTHRRRLADRNG